MSFAKGSGISSHKPLRAADPGERASRPLPSGTLRASMTLEAAMVVPLFLFFFLNVLNLFEAVRLQSSLQAVLQQCGEEMCEYAYYLEYAPEGSESGSGVPSETDSSGLQVSGGSGGAGAWIFTQAYVQGRVNGALGKDYIHRHCADGGITYLRSRILPEDGNILLIADYRFRPFIPFPGVTSFPMESRFFGHAWVGWKGGGTAGTSGAAEGNGPEEQVYVARYGEVYHRDSHCIYLNPQIRQVPASSLDTVRSGDGSIYHECELCHPGKSGMVLITKEGDRYHCDPGCPGIVRNVSEMTAQEASQSLRPCPICGGDGMNGGEQGGEEHVH